MEEDFNDGPPCAFWPELDFSGCGGHEPELRKLRDRSRLLVGKGLTGYPVVAIRFQCRVGSVIFKCRNGLIRATSFGLHHLFYHLLRDGAIEEVHLDYMRESKNNVDAQHELWPGSLSTLESVIDAVGSVVDQSSKRLRCCRLFYNVVPSLETMREVSRYYLFNALCGMCLPSENTALEDVLGELASVRRDKACRHIARVEFKARSRYQPLVELLSTEQIDRVIRFFQQEKLVMAHCMPHIVFQTYEGAPEDPWPSAICPRETGRRVEPQGDKFRRCSRWNPACPAPPNVWSIDCEMSLLAVSSVCCSSYTGEGRVQ